jgi:hypothetical protein
MTNPAIPGESGKFCLKLGIEAGIGVHQEEKYKEKSTYEITQERTHQNALERVRGLRKVPGEEL